MLDFKPRNITIINNILANSDVCSLLLKMNCSIEVIQLQETRQEITINEANIDLGDLIILGGDIENLENIYEIMGNKYPDIPVISLRDYAELETSIFASIFMRDVSDRLQHSHRIKLLKQQNLDLEIKLQKSKNTSDLAIKSQSEFLTRISHELRIPLNGILGFSQLMSWDKLLTIEQRGYTEIIYESGKHLLSLVNDILEMSKIQSHRLEIDKKVFVLREMINDLIHIFNPKAERKNLELIFKIAEEVPICIQSDEIKLRQILVNILNNAIQSTQVGSITVYTFIAKDILGQASHIVFEVEDTGRGIPLLEIDEIFEPFVKTGVKFEDGTGLGLSISKHFASLLGGDLKVISKLGEGTTFTLSIPSEIDHHFTSLSGNRPSILENHQSESASNLKILLAEDSLVDQKVLVRILNKMGYAVDVAGDGLEVLAALEANLYHIILMDVQMPKMDGIEATKQILQKFADAPVIIALTAGASEADRQRCINAGMQDFMTKPIRPKQLKAVLDDWAQKLCLG